jgi:hypothetical protein
LRPESAANFCRNRHCPKCQFLRKERWIEARRKDLLPIPYFHVVFTLPAELNPLVLRNRQILYDLFFRSVSETLMELARDPKRLGVDIGFIAVLHTWAQNLMDHPHIHCIVTGGGLSPEKERHRRVLMNSSLRPKSIYQLPGENRLSLRHTTPSSKFLPQLLLPSIRGRFLLIICLPLAPLHQENIIGLQNLLLFSR